MPSDLITQFTDADFSSHVLDSELPVLVDFWAEWCMPCRMIVPTLEKIAEDFKNRVKVGKVDIDTSREVATKYRISAIPTLLIFHRGEVSKKFVGVTPEGDLRNALEEVVS